MARCASCVWTATASAPCPECCSLSDSTRSSSMKIPPPMKMRTTSEFFLPFFHLREIYSSFESFIIEDKNFEKKCYILKFTKKNSNRNNSEARKNAPGTTRSPDTTESTQSDATSRSVRGRHSSRRLHRSC